MEFGDCGKSLEKTEEDMLRRFRRAQGHLEETHGSHFDCLFCVTGTESTCNISLSVPFD